jgi:predicted metalloprotease
MNGAKYGAKYGTMRQSIVKRAGAVALAIAATGFTAAGLAGDAAQVERMPGQSLSADESGTPPPAIRLRAIVARAWEDSIATWRRLIGARADEIAAVNLRFMPKLTPMNCYGLYAGEGPTYCSGNQTIFVGTDEAYRLMAKLGPQGEAGITFLIGHEMGHHIQNIHGRFHHLAAALTVEPSRRIELIRRFELEADCYAGVWIRGSEAWSASGAFRADLLSVLSSIGDDTLIGSAADARIQREGVHGTSEQRTRWFTRGTQSGSLSGCDTFAAAQP